jgi:hypothetical protein
MTLPATDFRDQTGAAIALIAENHRYKARLADLATLLDEGDPCAVLDRAACYATNFSGMRGTAAEIRAVSDTLRKVMAILEGDPEPEAVPVTFRPDDTIRRLVAKVEALEIQNRRYAQQLGLVDRDRSTRQPAFECPRCGESAYFEGPWSAARYEWQNQEFDRKHQRCKLRGSIVLECLGIPAGSNEGIR